MNSHYDIFYLEDFIGKYAAEVEKPLVYFRATGWNNSTDVDAINASYDVYRDFLPLDMFTVLSNSEFAFMEIEDIEDTLEFLGANFPESQATCAVPENYIFYAVYNAQGQLIANNE